VEDEIEEEVAHGKAHIVELLEEHRRHTMEHGGAVTVRCAAV